MLSEKETYFNGVCPVCKRVTFIRNTIDPYVRELYGEEKEIVLCDPCYRDRINEV